MPQRCQLLNRLMSSTPAWLPYGVIIGTFLEAMTPGSLYAQYSRDLRGWAAVMT